MAISTNIRVLHLVCVAAVLLVAAVRAQGGPELLINCWWFNGEKSDKNTKCPNSNTCCAPDAACLSNGLCHNPGDAPNTWVRGPCLVEGWDSDCGQVCKYDERDGRFPRVTQCAGGSLCCNDDPQCCQNGDGVFLDENGKIVASRATASVTSYLPGTEGLSRFPLSTSTSTTSTSTSSESSLAITPTSTTPSLAEGATSPPTTAAPAPTSDSDDSLGLKIGLGLGIPLAILMTAGVVYFLLRRRLGSRGGSDQHSSPQQEAQQYQQYPQYPPHPGPGSAAHHHPGYPYSLSADTYSRGPELQPPMYQPPPVELMEQGANELDGSHYGPQKAFELR